MKCPKCGYEWNMKKEKEKRKTQVVEYLYPTPMSFSQLKEKWMFPKQHYGVIWKN